MNGIKSIVLACALVTPTFAQDAWRVDAMGGVAYKHQVIDLPQDQGKLYTSVLGHPNDPQVQQLLRWFDQNPELNWIKNTTHFHYLSSDSMMFKSRYDATTGDLPCVRIQQPDGTVIYQCSANRLPLSAEALASSIGTTCLRRNVEPQPNLHFHYSATPDESDVTPKQDAQPDIFEKDNSMFEIPAWVFVTLGVVALVGGVGIQWSKELKNRG
jgi:hypothetical protein